MGEIAIVIDDSNDITAAVAVAYEVARELTGQDLTDEMPDPHNHPFFRWMEGRKWFDLERVRKNVEATAKSQGLKSLECWETVFELLIPEVRHVCFTTDEGFIASSPWADDCDF